MRRFSLRRNKLQAVAYKGCIWQWETDWVIPHDRSGAGLLHGVLGPGDRLGVGESDRLSLGECWKPAEKLRLFWIPGLCLGSFFKRLRRLLEKLGYFKSHWVITGLKCSRRHNKTSFQPVLTLFPFALFTASCHLPLWAGLSRRPGFNGGILKRSRLQSHFTATLQAEN